MYIYVCMYTAEWQMHALAHTAKCVCVMCLLACMHACFVSHTSKTNNAEATIEIASTATMTAGRLALDNCTTCAF